MQMVSAKNSAVVTVQGGITKVAETPALTLSLGDLVIVHGSFVGQMAATATGNVHSYLTANGGTGAVTVGNGLNCWAQSGPPAPGEAVAMTPSGAFECVRAGAVTFQLSGLGACTVMTGDGFLRAYVIPA